MNRFRICITLLMLFMVSACQHNDEQITASVPSLKLADKPNILWLVIEDMSPVLPDFGDPTVATPNISKLAAEGVKYTNVYSVAGVCAPSRAALATGMYPTSFGASHMRTTSNTKQTGLPKYEAIPPVGAKMLSQYMREQGYYTTNNLKNDYQFIAPKAAWHENGRYAHWRHRPANQPFYAVFNFTTTHESGLFEPYGFRKVESRHYFSDDAERIARLPQHQLIKSKESETPIHLAKQTEFNIPPYLPDTPVVRRDMWKMYNNLIETDRQIGAIIQQLKDDGLYDNTIIVFYSDHGGPLPRQKRLIYDSGLKVPMVIRYPQAQRAGEVDDQLISFVDFAPATLALAGLETPKQMHGRDFIFNQTPPREYIHAAADRFDEVTDAIRAVKDKRFKYIRNYRPEQGYYLPLAYRERIPTMQELLRLKAEGKLTPEQAQWFREFKYKEELFDTLKDPHELHDLAQKPDYQETVKRLSSEMDRWIKAIGDQPNLDERKLIDQLWKGSPTQPITAAARVVETDGMVSLISDTQGATISYQVIENGKEPSVWQLYEKPFSVTQGSELKVVAHRIGFQESRLITYGVDSR